MNGKILTVLLVVSMVSVCIPAVFAIPDQPTKEEEKEIIEKYIEKQSGSKGWTWVSLPNANGNTAGSNDICPELKRRAQYNLANRFMVEYSIESSNSVFQDSWHDNLTTDQDTGEYEPEDDMYWSGYLYYGDNLFQKRAISISLCTNDSSNTPVSARALKLSA
jgi:hypothetical protein